MTTKTTSAPQDNRESRSGHRERRSRKRGDAEHRYRKRAVGEAVALDEAVEAIELAGGRGVWLRGAR